MRNVFLVAYDVADDKRRTKVFKKLKGRGEAVQYSVFLFSGTEAQLQRCLDKLQALMDERYDDIRAYPLPQRGLRLVLGASPLPEGIVLGSLPANWQGTPL